MNKKRIADKDIKAVIETARRYARRHGAIGIIDEDDLVQNLMIRWMKTSIGHVPPRAWFAKTMRCVVYDQLRKMQVSPVLEDENLEAALEDGSVSESGALYCQRDSVEVDLIPNLVSVLSKLTQAFREALVLDAEGYTYSEIASMTGEQIGTVRSRLHYARKKIRQYRHYFD
jgi:RNA polymerase sigma-70 factor (ECF subfamily)